MKRITSGLLTITAASLLVACSGDSRSVAVGGAAAPATSAGTPSAPATPMPPMPSGPAAAIPGTTIAMDFTRANGFWSSPFPDESRRKIGGAVDMSGFPDPGNGNLLIQDLVRIVERDADGFGTTSAVFFRTDDLLDPASFPTLHDTVQPGSPAFLLCVDPASPDFLERVPVEIGFQNDGGNYGDANLLSLLPLQGAPLREDTLYAAVVLRDLGDAGGAPLGVALPLAQLVRGQQPQGMLPAAFAAHQQTVGALRQAGVDPERVAGLATFRTGNPTVGLDRFVQDALAQGLPQPTRPPTLVRSYPDYHLLHTTIRMPIYQAGVPPFVLNGGAWLTDTSGAPIRRGTEEANLYLTIPRGPMPAGGFPAVVMVRTGFGNGATPITDRGVQSASAPTAPGSGPGLEFARAGFMGVQVDGPHGGLRNVSGLDEQMLIFNVSNLAAMRDNVRQSALELIVLGEVLPTLSVDPAQAPGVTTGSGPIIVDTGHVALFGHSMGATIAPLVLAGQPRYRAGILSGAGGSWIENLVHKQSPVPTRPLAELLLGYTLAGRSLHEHDPALNVLQWAGEAADPPVYGRLVTSEPRRGDPRHVLMLQGIVDTYILPPIANALSLSLGLEQGGPALDAQNAYTRSTFATFLDVAPLTGCGPTALPAQGNRTFAGRPTTALLIQHPEDGYQDGHEVVFQTAAPKQQYRAFLRSYLSGVPRVP